MNHFDSDGTGDHGGGWIVILIIAILTLPWWLGAIFAFAKWLSNA